jgi:hypothetical protein
MVQDSAGEACAFGWWVDGAGWVEVPGVATFRFVPGYEQVAAIPHPGIDDHAIIDAYLGTALPLALQASSKFEVVHGGAVLDRDRVVAFCGVSGVGKTTISHALAARGPGLWADDAVAVAVDLDGGPVSMSLPFVPNLREASRTVLEPLEPFPPWQIAPLAAIILLEPSPDAPRPVVSIEASASRALTSILPNAYRFVPRSEGERRETLELLLDLVSHVPVLRARYRLRLDELPLLADEFERAIGEFAP